MGLDVGGYLARIGYDGPTAPTTETLFALQRQHLLAVPFDALDCHLGVPISLEPAALYDKIVRRRRGGFCYELNGLFGLLLEELGFDVRRLAARPFTKAGLAPPFAHLALLVETERRWLADVGFGYWTREPLDVDEPEIQRRDGLEFRVGSEPDAAAAPLLAADLLGMRSRNGYAFTLQPHEMAEYAEQCRAYSTDPQSGFVLRATLSQAFPDGWITVTRESVAGTRGGRTFDRPIADDADWRRTARELLGVDVPPLLAG